MSRREAQSIVGNWARYDVAQLGNVLSRDDEALATVAEQTNCGVYEGMLPILLIDEPKQNACVEKIRH